MLDINISFANLFAGCFSKKPRNNTNDDIEIIRRVIKNMPNKQKMDYVLGRIKNGKYHVVFLNRLNKTTHKNYSTVGTYNVLIVNTFYSVIIPIIIDDVLSFSLVLCSHEKLTLKYDHSLVDLLTEILEDIIKTTRI